MLTWQHTRPVYLPSFVCCYIQHKDVLVQWRNPFPSVVPVCVYVTHLLPACYLEEHIPRRGGHPSERRVALIRRCHLPGSGTDLAWRERRSDSPATKIRPFSCLGKRLAPPPLTNVWTHKHKVKKSSRSVCTHAATACQCRSARQVSTCRGWLGKNRMASGGKGGGREGRGARGRQKLFKWWDKSRKASSHSA